VTDSTVEAEYIEASGATKEGVWMRRFLIELGVFPDASCNTPGVCHSLSSGFELKHNRLSGDNKVKVNLWRGA
jgi:hypothetical protein